MVQGQSIICGGAEPNLFRVIDTNSLAVRKFIILKYVYKSIFNLRRLVPFKTLKNLCTVWTKDLTEKPKEGIMISTLDTFSLQESLFSKWICCNFANF